MSLLHLLVLSHAIDPVVTLPEFLAMLGLSRPPAEPSAAEQREAEATWPGGGDERSPGGAMVGYWL